MKTYITCLKLFIKSNILCMYNLSVWLFVQFFFTKLKLNKILSILKNVKANSNPNKLSLFNLFSLIYPSVNFLIQA